MISDGDTDLTSSLYEELYYKKYINHWRTKDSETLELDLHDYSRGMAFAAIKLAIKEVYILLLI